MIVPKLAFRKLVRSSRNSLVLISLVSTGVFLFILGDAILGSATAGMQSEFRDGYTGDIAIRAQFERKFGIFGFSIPMIGAYEDIPTLSQVPEIRNVIAQYPFVAASAGLVSGAALLEGSGGYQVKVPVFGVKAEEYYRFFPAIRFIEGRLPRDDEAWIVLPRSRAEEIGAAEGRQLEIGELLQLTMATGSAFTIRAVMLAGIVETPLKGGPVAIPVYTDPITLRALLGLVVGSGDSDGAEAAPSQDLDSFFSDSPSSVGVPGDEGPGGLGLLDQYFSKNSETGDRPDPELGAWHFLLVRLAPGESGFMARKALNRALRELGIAVEAVDWLGVAGLNAGILFLLKTVFQIGMGILAAVVVLVLTNGLAFSVLEQTQEIGSMRAIGGQKGLIRRIYLFQAIILVGTGALAGIIAGAIVLKAIGSVGIPITNAYLYQLFGTRLLMPAFRCRSALASLCGAALVAVVSSIYPMSLAMRTSIAETMATE